MVSIGRVGGGITEGSYTSWTLKWSMTPPNGFYSSSDGAGFYMDENNNVFYLMWQALSPSKNRFGVFKLIDHSLIYESSPDEDFSIYGPYMGGGDYTFELGCHGGVYSIMRSHQTYILANPLQSPYGFQFIEVWKAGVKIWSRNITLDTGDSGGEGTSLEISLTGKYIMVFDIYSLKLLLYEGT